MKKILPLILFVVSYTTLSQSITLDTSYGVNGYTLFDSKTTDHLTYSKILNDGSILVSSSRYNTINAQQELLLIKYNSSGNIDTSFGTNGEYIISHSDDNGVEIILDTNENIYLFANVFEAKMFKLTPNGSLDINFGSNGVLTLFDNTTSFTPDYAAIVDGGIIIGASYVLNSTEKTTLKKIDFNGNFLTSFGTNGIVDFDFNLYEIKAPESNGFFVSGGYNDSSFTIIKFDSNGTKDITFATNGELTDNDRSTIEYFRMYKIDNNYYTNIFYETSTSSEVSKYDLNGNLDTSFGNNGRLSFVSSLITDIHLYNNNLYITGFNIPDFNGSVYSFDLNGSVNSVFSNNGVYNIPSNNYKDLPLNLHIENNNLVITGSQRYSNTDVKHYSSKYNISSATASNQEIENFNITFKNPIEDEVEVFSKNAQITKLTIFSLDGKHIKTSNSNKIKTENLSQNLYILNCHLENGNIVSKKIIKQ